MRCRLRSMSKNKLCQDKSSTSDEQSMLLYPAGWQLQHQPAEQAATTATPRTCCFGDAAGVAADTVHHQACQSLQASP